jgi:hypothetical protein
MPKRKRNPMASGNPGLGEWWRRMMQKVKPSAKVYGKPQRRENKVNP